MDKTGSVSQTTPSASGRKGMWWAMLVLAMAGLLVSVILAHIHYKVHTQADFHSFCGQGTTFNCDDVARTRYAILLGVPTAWWGIFGYLLAAAVAVTGLRSRRVVLVAGCALMLFAGFAAVSASLGSVSTFRLRAFCPLCVVTYGINLLLFILGLVHAIGFGLRQVVLAPWMALREQPGKVGIVLGLLGAVAGGLMALFPAYWQTDAHSEKKWMSLEGVARGQTHDGGYWIGAENPTVTLTEFSDYECPGCKQTHEQIRNLVMQFAEQLRIIHRHFPLDQSCNRSIDHPFHQNSCRAAAIAECAGKVGRFWQANDYLFEQAGEIETRSTEQIAADLKLDSGALERCLQGDGPAAVKNDIELGIALNLRGTPSFVVDGQVYFGNLPAPVLERLRPIGGK